VVLSDEIYDQILYDDAEFVPMATLVHNTLLLHDERFVQGVSSLRLSGRLGRIFPAISKARANISAVSNCCPPCASAAMCRVSGRCKRRSAAIKAFAN